MEGFEGTFQETLAGMDYGVRPRFMLMANLALMELWQNAKCCALGYLELPEHQGHHDVPSVGIVFEDLENGRRFFELIRGWDCEPGSGFGTDISFIKDASRGSYTLTIGPNYDELIKRVLEPAISEDFSVMVGSATIGKTCFLSQHFGWLREQAKTKPVVFIPASVSGEPLTEYAYLKTDVRFLDREEIQPNTVEYAMVAAESERPFQPKEPPVEPDQIARTRGRRLKKFYAVTMRRLEFNPSFVEAVRQLNDRHEAWQLTQAACNLLCADRFTDADARPDFAKLYESLRREPELIGDNLSLKKQFTAEGLAEQVRNDLQYLWHQLRPGTSSRDAEYELRKLGLVK